MKKIRTVEVSFQRLYFVSENFATWIKHPFEMFARVLDLVLYFCHAERETKLARRIYANGACNEGVLITDSRHLCTIAFCAF